MYCIEWKIGYLSQTVIVSGEFCRKHLTAFSKCYSETFNHFKYVFTLTSLMLVLSYSRGEQEGFIL